MDAQYNDTPMNEYAAILRFAAQRLAKSAERSYEVLDLSSYNQRVGGIYSAHSALMELIQANPRKAIECATTILKDTDEGKKVLSVFTDWVDGVVTERFLNVLLPQAHVTPLHKELIELYRLVDPDSFDHWSRVCKHVENEGYTALNYHEYFDKQHAKWQASRFWSKLKFWK